MGGNSELVEQFRDLHERASGFVMPNAWDGTSALLMKDAGFEALGSSSAAIAFSLGRNDGAHAVTLGGALENAKLLARVSGLPINGDLEDGFGPSPEHVAATIEAAIEAGLAGVGIEDTTANPEFPIHAFDDAVARIRAAVKAADGRIVVTGRTDNYLQGREDLDDTIRRLTAFAEAGADVLFAPFPPDVNAIRAIVKAVAPKPVNVVMGPESGIVPVAELQAAGVRRISLGAAFYSHAMGSVRDAAKRLARGEIAPVASGMRAGEIAKLIRQSST